MTRLAEEFKKNIKSRLMEVFKYKNIHQVPKITKIVFFFGFQIGTKCCAFESKKFGWIVLGTHRTLLNSLH